MQNFLLDLPTLGGRIRKVDATILELLQRRMELSRDVGRYKASTGQQIVRYDVERQRLEFAKQWAETHGLDPYFAGSLFHAIINESCKVQTQQLQDTSRQVKAPNSSDEWLQYMKRNLEVLTRQSAATYDSAYDRHYFATRSYLEYELNLMQQEVAKLPHADNGVSTDGIALDLGCATGRVALQLAQQFQFVAGFDLSPEMVARADHNSRDAKLDLRTEFACADLEQGIPRTNNYAMFVAMTLGTASDIPDIKRVLKEIMRVLKPGGRFVLSFYNREALLYHWDFIPWEVDLAASMNRQRDCLEVHFGNEAFYVYAKAFSVEEVKALLHECGAADTHVCTYPTISSILPNELFADQPESGKFIEELDRSLAAKNGGAYIIASGMKMPG